MTDLLSALFTDLTFWGALLGVVTPLVTAVAQQPYFTKRVRTALGVSASAVVGLLTVLANGELQNAPATVTTVVTVILAAEVAYRNVWQPSGLTDSIEWATAVNPRG